MKARTSPPAGGEFDETAFDAFYDRALPVVHGYLLRLCGGDQDVAWDLTQDTWLALVGRLSLGEHDKANIGWLLSVARSRFFDQWRRRRRLEGKLRLVWTAERDRVPLDVSVSDVLEHISTCTPDHRVMLMLVYVDDFTVPEAARTIGVSSSTAYSMLARARAELRRRMEDPSDV